MNDAKYGATGNSKCFCNIFLEKTLSIEAPYLHNLDISKSREMPFLSYIGCTMLVAVKLVVSGGIISEIWKCIVDADSVIVTGLHPWRTGTYKGEQNKLMNTMRMFSPRFTVWSVSPVPIAARSPSPWYVNTYRSGSTRLIPVATAVALP